MAGDLAATQPAAKAGVKVLRSSNQAQQELLERERAVAASYKEEIERLQQANAKLKADRKQLKQEACAEREGRLQAEQCVAKLKREAEQATAAQLRLEEAFGKAMMALRHVRSQYSGAISMAQHLAREVVLLRQSSGSPAAFSGRGVVAPGTPRRRGSSGSAGSCSNDADKQAHQQPAKEASMPMEQLLAELASLRSAKAAAECASSELKQRLAQLAVEKERAEDSADMVSLQTQCLLSEKLRLLDELKSKDAAVRGLEQGIEQLLYDRELLQGQMARIASTGDFAALAQLASGGDVPDGNEVADYDTLDTAAGASSCVLQATASMAHESTALGAAAQLEAQVQEALQLGEDGSTLHAVRP